MLPGVLNRIGLIAGNGKFPIILARSAKEKGVEVTAIAITGETSRELENFVHKIIWLGVGELEGLIRILKQEKLTSVMMAGQVKHKTLFDKGLKIDARMSALLNSLRDKKTDSIIGAVARILNMSGIKVLKSTMFLADYMPKKGVLTSIAPRENVLKDIEFGKRIAKAISGLDIGQSVAVKDRIVLAIESIEGTDEAIKRAAHFGKEGIVVVKVSKPRQDMRFDVPVIGPDTIMLLKEVKAACIAIEANKTLIIDKEDTLRSADQAGIVVVAI